MAVIIDYDRLIRRISDFFKTSLNAGEGEKGPPDRLVCNADGAGEHDRLCAVAGVVSAGERDGKFFAAELKFCLQKR